MPRELKPCGTWAAYMRHKRRHEPIDDECAQAAREQKNTRAETKRDRTAAAVKLAIVDAESTEPDPEEIDQLAEARDTLRMVKAAMRAGAPGMSALAKQRMELVAQIARLEAASKPRESKLDELARRRAERIAAAQA